MLFNAKLLIATLVLCGALQINSTPVPKIGNDVVLGELTEASVLAHRSRITSIFSGQLSFHGLYNITRIEVLDQTNGTGYLASLEGGLNTFHVRLHFFAIYPHPEFDFIVNIYGEPLDRLPSNDFVLGAETANSRLIHTERVSFIIGGNFGWSGPFRIVKVEALDQSDGFGGYVYEFKGGVNTSSVDLYMASVFPDSLVDFIINIFVENFPNNDFIDGNLTENSTLLHTERVIGDHMNWSNESFVITRLEALDQTNGSGGHVNFVGGGVGYRHTDLYFSAWYEGSSIDFIVNVFGEPVQSNDVILGESYATNVLLESRRITETQLYIYSFSGPHVISRIELLDQSNGGYVADVLGGLSFRYVYVIILPVSSTSTIDFIANVYGHPLTPNHFFDGVLTNSSALVHQERIINESGGSTEFYWRGFDTVITRIEARDQSAGDGGSVAAVYSGVNATFAQITFSSVYNYSRIDFIIDIYGESYWPSVKLN